MPINPNIALSFKPTYELESPQNIEANVMKLQGAKYANELARMQSQEYARGLQEQENLRNYLAARPDLSFQEAQSELTRFGKPGLDMLESAVKLKKEQTESKAKSEDLIGKVYSRYQTMLDSAKTPGELAAGQIAMHNDEVLGPIFKQMGMTPEAGLAQISKIKTPDEFRHVQMMMSQGTSKYLQSIKPHVMVQGNRLVSIDPVSGQIKPVEGSEYTPPITPFQQQSLAMQERLAGQGVTYQTDANGNVIALPSKVALGAAPVATPVTGAEGAPVKAKLSPLAEKTKIQRAQMARDIDLAITELGNAIKPGGTLEKATASGAGRLVDEAAKFIGKSTPGSIAADELRPIADLVLKMVPRFEGPQSDKDRVSYEQASGQLANENIPVERRKAAAQVVLRLLKTRKNQFVNQSMAAEGVEPAAAAAAGGVKFLGFE